MKKSLYNAIMESHLAAVEQALPQYLPTVDAATEDTVFRAMEYACAAGGKRLRPVLLMEFCRICGGDVQLALPFACAIEMVHSYSLVHDDLPCMDNSMLRRGRPSTHAEFGETMALLAGDALLNRAFEVMLDPDNQKKLTAESVMHAAFCLANASGAYGMVGGQVLDLKSEGQAIDLPTLEKLQQGKTAALIIAACKMGCYVARADEEKLNAAHSFGEQLGRCFQIVDDILDATATAEQLGKPIGSDSEHEKATYVSLLGLEKAKQLAAERTELAQKSLFPFGKQAEGLRELAYTLLQRNV